MELDTVAARIQKRNSQIAAATTEAELRQLAIEGDLLTAQLKNLRHTWAREQQNLSQQASLARALEQKDQYPAALVDFRG